MHIPQRLSPRVVRDHACLALGPFSPALRDCKAKRSIHQASFVLSNLPYRFELTISRGMMGGGGEGRGGEGRF